MSATVATSRNTRRSRNASRRCSRYRPPTTTSIASWIAVCVAIVLGAVVVIVVGAPSRALLAFLGCDITLPGQIRGDVFLPDAPALPDADGLQLALADQPEGCRPCDPEQLRRLGDREQRGKPNNLVVFRLSMAHSQRVARRESGLRKGDTPQPLTAASGCQWRLCPGAASEHIRIAGGERWLWLCPVHAKLVMQQTGMWTERVVRTETRWMASDAQAEDIRLKRRASLAGEPSLIFGEDLIAERTLLFDYSTGDRDIEDLEPASRALFARTQGYLAENLGRTLSPEAVSEFEVTSSWLRAALVRVRKGGKADAKRLELEIVNDRPLTVCVGSSTLVISPRTSLRHHVPVPGCHRVFPDSVQHEGGRRMHSLWCESCEPSKHPRRNARARAAYLAFLDEIGA